MHRKAVFLFLAISITLCGVAYSAPQAQHDVDLQHLQQARDLQPLVSRQKLSEGLNRILTTPEGVSLSARVEDGKITQWIATDRQGKTAEVRDYSLVRQDATGARSFLSCWVCFKVPGGWICYRVPCYKAPYSF